jgi:hypothetical protein
MSERLAELQRILGQSRRKLGALAERLGEVRRQLGAPPAAGAGENPRPFEDAVPGARDIEDLDLKFEVLEGDGADRGKLSEPEP